jgi:hypothetical protein
MASSIRGQTANALILDDDFGDVDQPQKKPPALCSQCAGGKKNFFEGKCSKKDSDAGNYLFAYCDGCGVTFVDHLGHCVDPDCKLHGKTGLPNLLVRDVVHLSGAHKATVVRAINKGELKAVRNSHGAYLIKPQDAKDWIASRQV